MIDGCSGRITMSSPMSVAARLLGRLLNPAPALIIAGSMSLAPAIVAEARGNSEWQVSGFHNSTQHMVWNYTPPPISSRDLRLFAEVLHLDEAQREIMSDMHAEYVRAYNREWTLNAERHSDARVRREAERVGRWHGAGFPELQAQFDATTEGLESAALVGSGRPVASS